MIEKRVVFMGTPEFSVPILEKLIEVTNVVGVVTREDKEVGRKRILTESPVKICALAHGITVLTPSKLKEEYQDILDLEPDIIITCAYGKIVPKVILEYPRYGCINVHGSVLPKLRGASPIQSAVIEGYKKTGITIMYMDEGMDTGNIIKESEMDIDISDTYGTLSEKLSILGRDLLIDVLPSIFDGTNESISQDETLATYTKLIKREDETLNFNDKALNIYNKVRGLNPNPLANITINGLEWKIYEVIIGDASTKEPGIITNIDKNYIYISTLDKDILLKRVKVQGKKEMDVKDLINGIKKDELLNKKVGV